MRCQEVRGGAIIKVIINTLITAIITILAAGPSTASLKTASKVDLGDKKVRTPNHSNTGVSSFHPQRIQ